MRRPTGVLTVASCVALSGCLSGFAHPLGPAEDGFIESELLGRWECVSAEDQEPGALTFFDFDGRQYYMLSTEEGTEEPGHLRAHATRIDGVPFLNVQAIGPKPKDEDEWNFIEYTFPDADHLTLRIVNPQLFEEIAADAHLVREHLASHRNEPDALVDLLSCERGGRKGVGP